MGYNSQESVPFNASDIRSIKLKLIKTSVLFVLLSFLPASLLFYTFSNPEFQHTLFSIDGIAYHMFFLLLPALVVLKKYRDIKDGRKLLKQGEKIIERTKITSKEDKIHYAKNSTAHNYTVGTESGTVTIRDSYFGKSKDKIFALLHVGSEVEIIYSKDYKTLLDIRALNSEGKQSDLSELKDTVPLSAPDKNTLLLVCRRKWLANIYWLIMLTLLAVPITVVGLTDDLGGAGIYLILISDGALFLFSFMISRKFISDYFRNKKTIYITVVTDKINRKRHGVIFNNTPFINKDDDYFSITTPLMEFFVPQELYEALKAGDSVRLEVGPSSKTLLSISKV